MSKPAVSVIMATYNGAALVAETIRSVLSQNFTDFELIAVDDCSTDNTVEVLGRFHDGRIRIMSTGANSGPVNARNLAVSAARGRYLAALDQDDLCLPQRFAKQVAYLDAHPAVAVLGTATRRLVDGKLRRDRFGARTTPAFLQWMLHVMNPLVWSSVMLRASAAQRLSVFSRVDRQYAEDFDLYHRLSAFGEVARLDEVLTLYRWHAQGASSTRASQMQANAAAVLEEAYAPWFGGGAAQAARLMSRHVAARQPVPDLDTFLALRRVFSVLHGGFTATNRPGAGTEALIAQQTVRLLLDVAMDAAKGWRKDEIPFLFEKSTKRPLPP
jgi:GT2 family glycosyltransferase